jgi:hypothetical protein
VVLSEGLTVGLSAPCCRFIAEHVLPLLQRKRKVIALGVPTITDEHGAAREYVAYFGSLGFGDILSVDVHTYENPTIAHDLNRPLINSEFTDADLVIDPGTIEHVFNVPSALSNVVRMLAIGGVVFHLSPLNWVNHGFYNFSPALFHDYYTVNGFTGVRTFRYDVGNQTVEPWPYDPAPTVILPERRFLLLTRAQKAQDVHAAAPLQKRFETTWGTGKGHLAGGNWA